VRHNGTTTRVVQFLLYFGLPWLRLRHAIRANKWRIMDLTWILFYHYFRACNKYQYATMAVYVTATRFSMVTCIERSRHSASNPRPLRRARCTPCGPKFTLSPNRMRQSGTASEPARSRATPDTTFRGTFLWSG
jgi:hypothetical protein